MANVKTQLNKILTAIYGKDVREAIHDSIEAINTQVETTTANEATRQSQEQKRIENENNRTITEQNRQQAEQNRQQAEQARRDQEVLVTEREQQRVAAETKRLENEQARVERERAREQGFNENLRRIKQSIDLQIVVDPSLTKPGQAADAKQTGEALKALKESKSTLRTGFGKVEKLSFNTKWVAPEDGLLNIFIDNLIMETGTCACYQTPPKTSATTVEEELLWWVGVDDYPYQNTVIPVIKNYSYRFKAPKNLKPNLTFFSLGT